MLYGEDLERYLVFKKNHKIGDILIIKYPVQYLLNCNSSFKDVLKDKTVCKCKIQYIGNFGFTACIIQDDEKSEIELHIPYIKFEE